MGGIVVPFMKIREGYGLRGVLGKSLGFFIFFVSFLKSKCLGFPLVRMKQKKTSGDVFVLLLITKIPTSQ